jgi:hypothetical protein
VLGVSRQSDTQSDTSQSDCCGYEEGAKDELHSHRWFLRRISCVKIVVFHFGFFLGIGEPVAHVRPVAGCG